MANQPKKYKKFVATAATATLVASAIVPVASAASLSDIAGNTHEEAITSLVDAGVINGYPDGTFQPNKTLTRSDVVKLLGKYLVSKGLEVPADYKTNVRFNDLTSASNDELLKYAAVVYDAGVFNGSNGNLLAGDNITRENMAVVLVRAFDTLNNIDLVSYVQGQEYKKDVKDLYTAKSEARSAIEVLDFFDITNPAVANFNPKGSTTRGQFATFLYKTINTDFSAVTGVANSAVSEIKAINNTTVEVTFKETVENIEALDFTIDGLEVKNAVVKQTDAKTVVLTTAAQTGDTVYTLNVNAAKAGTFKGVSAVIPTAVTMSTPSVQGKLGQQVTVKAQVTVAEGQSKAGIPVTLFVPGSADGLKAPVTVEAVTNAEGVATYTYTRYAATNDTVTAYASGDRSKFATGFVFWGVDSILAVEEVTTGATINNGANKTYKVTYKNPTTGKVEANKKFNVSVLENINVTADKLQNVKVNGVAVKQLSNNTITEVATITTDSKGEATFTLSGTNAEVTPVVYEVHSTTTNNVTTDSKKYEASDLQATAAKVKFAALQAEYTIELTRDGGEVAATGEGNGREYKVLVKDKNGAVAKNETVNVAFNEDLDRVISTNTKAGFVDPDTEKFYPTSGTSNTKSQISVKTNDKGEATFIIASNSENDYATPIAWVDINSSDAKRGALDEGEPKTIAAISHFQAAYLDGAAIKSYKASKKETKFNDNEIAEFRAELVNQSGKTFSTGEYTMGKVTYTVFNTGGEDIEVDTVNGKVVISPNRSETFTKDNGASLFVNAKDGKTTSVRVIATGIAYKGNQDFSFTAKEATATFTNSEVVAAPYTGYISKINTLDSGTDSNSLWFAGKKPIKYTGTNVEYYGANGNQIFGEIAWENHLISLKDSDVTVSYSKDGEKTIFKVISVVTPASPGSNTFLGDVRPAAANKAPVAKVIADQTVASNGTALSFTATEVATDEDAGDTLKILTAYTSNASVATATVAPDQLSFTVTPVANAVGSTVVTLVVTDGKENINVTFKVNVTAAQFLSVLKGGAPTLDYSAGVATSPKSVITVGSNAVTAAGKLTITADKTIDVSLEIGDDKDDILAAINTELASVVSEAVASLDASDNIVLTRPTTGTASVLTVAADAALEINNAAPTINNTVASNGTPTKAKYAFDVKNAITAGSKLTVEVKIGDEKVTLVEGTDFTGAATAALTATAIANALDAELDATTTTYTVAANGTSVVLTQDVAAPTTNVTLSVSTK